MIRRKGLNSPIEALESRIAPASVFTYIDVDGDKVKITSSLGSLDGKITFVSVGTGDQIQLIDLTAAEFAGSDLTVKVTKAKTGDGYSNIGFIDATGQDLGKVKIAGDLGRIAAGDDNPDGPALESLSVRSMGVFGIATQIEGANLTSVIKGDIGSLKVTRDVREASFTVAGAIGSLSIGGSLIGGAGDKSGNFEASASIGSVTIGKDLIGGLGWFSAVIQSTDSSIGDVKIGGSFVGGPGEVAGMISASASLGNVAIGKTLRGGSAVYAGLIRSETDSVGNVSIGGSFIGGTADEAGYLWAAQSIGNVKIGGTLQGGTGPYTGAIKALAGSIENVTIGKGVIGGTADQTAEIFARLDIKSLKVGGDVRGGTAAYSGNLEAEAGKIGTVSIKGDLVGGGAYRSGVLLGQKGLGAVTISGSVIGGAAEESGIVIAPEGDAKSVSILGSLIGANFSQTGFVNIGGSINSVKISGDILGGPSNETRNVDYTGAILGGSIGSITVGGSIISGTNSNSLGRSGAIQSARGIGSITVNGDLVGNSTHGIAITAVGEAAPTATRDEAIGEIKVKGDVSYARIMGGVAPSYDYVNGNAQIGQLTVGGHWFASSLSAGIYPGLDGYFGNGTDTVIGSGTLSKIASVTVRGPIVGTDVVGDHFGFVAHVIGSFRNGGITVHPSLGTPVFELAPLTMDTKVALA